MVDGGVYGDGGVDTGRVEVVDVGMGWGEGERRGEGKSIDARCCSNTPAEV